VTAFAVIATLAVPYCRCVRISPDGSSVLTVGAGTMAVRDAVTGASGWARPWQTMAEFPVEAVWGAGGDSITLLSDGRLSLVDASTGADLQVPDELATRRDVTALALSVNGLTFAVGTSAGIVLLWRQDTGRVTRLRGGGDPVNALAWRPNDDELCVARPRTVQFWLLKGETMISSIDVTSVRPRRLTWSPDGDHIVTVGVREVRVVSLATRSESASPLVIPGGPIGAGFSRTGATLLVGRPDGTVALLDRQLRPVGPSQAVLGANLAEATNLHVNESGLVAVRADAASVTLLSLSDSLLPSPERRTAVALRRWAVKVARTAGRMSGEPLPPPVPTVLARRSGFAWTEQGWYLQHRRTGEVRRYAADGSHQWTARAGTGPLSVRGESLAVGDPAGQVTILGADGGQVASVPGTGPAAWGASGFAVPAAGRRDLFVYDRSGRRLRALPVPDGVGDAAWSPDGTVLAAPTSKAVVLWDGQTLARIRSLDDASGPQLGAVVWSPDGGYLAVDRPGRRVTVWATGEWRAGPPLAISGGTPGQAMSWSPDSRLLAIASRRFLGAVDLWDVRTGRVVLTIPPPSPAYGPVATVHWAADGRFAIVHDDGTVVRWELAVPQSSAHEQPPLRHEIPMLVRLVAAMAACRKTAPLPLLIDLLSLLLGSDAGPLSEYEGHPGVGIVRGLRWPPNAVVGFAVLVTAGLPADAGLLPPEDTAQDELRAVLAEALVGVSGPLSDYSPPRTELLAALDGIDDSVLLLATLLGPDAVAAEPDLLAKVRSRSFGRWSFAPAQRRLLGLRFLLDTNGSSQGHGVGGTRAGISRNGELSSLLPSQLALPRSALAAKKSRDELLYRTRQGALPVEAQPVVLLLDDTAAAFGAVGVMLRIVANLLASVAIRQHRRCAMVPLGAPRVRLLQEMADLVDLWSTSSVERPDLADALVLAGMAAGQLSDPLSGLPRLVLLTHPYLAAPTRPGLHIVRVHYPRMPVEDPAARTHVLAPDAGTEQLQEVIGEILND